MVWTASQVAKAKEAILAYLVVQANLDSRARKARLDWTVYLALLAQKATQASALLDDPEKKANPASLV